MWTCCSPKSAQVRMYFVSALGFLNKLFEPGANMVFPGSNSSNKPSERIEHMRAQQLFLVGPRSNSLASGGDVNYMNQSGH